MKSYPAYKDSGIKWIGEIPEHWEIKKLKYFAQISNGQDQKDVLSDEGQYPVLGTGGIFGRATKFLYDKPSVLLGRKGTIDNPFYIEEPFWTVDTLFYTKIHEGVFPKYFYYSCRCIDFDKYKTGSAVPSMTQDTLLNIHRVYPSFSEQNAIAAFLDQKTGEIDQLISAKEELIQKLEAQRKAIINEAVTGQAYKTGLIQTPDGKKVKFKYSGIEWLGEIPEHWEAVKLKYLVKKIGSGVTPRGGSEVYTEEGIPLLRSQNIHFDGLRLEGVARIPEIINRQMSSTVVHSNDVLLNITGASIGRCFYVDDNLGEANVNQHVCIIRPELNKISTKYLNYFLSSSCGQFQISAGQDGTSREGLNFEEIKNFFINIPPLIEMDIIAHWIQLRMEETMSIKDQTIQSLSRLKQYKQSLISEAVTGKIDLRDWKKD